VDVEGQHAAAQRAHAVDLLVLRHGHRLADAADDRGDVVRVHHDRVAQLFGGAGELAQDHDAALVDPRRDELLRHQVHPVAKRRHEDGIRRQIQRHELLRRHRLVDVVHRHRAHRSVGAVDAPDQLLDVAAEVLVAAHRFARGRRHLHHADAVAKRRIVLEHRLERHEPLADALRVVETIHRHEQRAAAGLVPQLADGRLGGRV
jgi:hypothetical protein